MKKLFLMFVFSTRGSYDFIENMTIEDLIVSAGGLK